VVFSFLCVAKEKKQKKGDFFQIAYAFVETMAYAGRMKKDSSTLLAHRSIQLSGAGFLAITYSYRASCSVWL
jgi:hypothetical protein